MCIYLYNLQGNQVLLKYFLAPDTFSDTEGSGIGNEGTFRVPIHESFWFEEIEEVGKDVNLIFTIPITPNYIRFARQFISPNNINRIYH